MCHLSNCVRVETLDIIPEMFSDYTIDQFVTR